MACLGECWDSLGPPPNSILFMPPPPLPVFLQSELLLQNGSSCVSPQLCEIDNRVVSGGGNGGVGGEFVELPRKDLENWSPTIDDTWLLVLVASFIGVLILGALLAMFLLKCREMNMFGSSDCSLHARHQIKVNHHEGPPLRDCNTLNGNGKLVHPSETMYYHPSNLQADNRMVWAALTPHGTQHFISENYPRDLVVDYVEADDHYERVDHLAPQYYRKEGSSSSSSAKKSFDNSAFVDTYEYEDPAPLIESYQLNDRQQQQQQQPQHHHHYATLGGGNTDMRCVSLRRHNPNLIEGAFVRPRVSSPTRIEHPNLPPLNLYPHNTLKKNGTLSSYRNGDTLPKYA